MMKLPGRSGLVEAPTIAIRRTLAQERDRPGRVEHRHRPGALLEVEHLARPAPLLGGHARGHPVLSRSYGLPTAAGGMLRPTTPASTMIVTRYGSAVQNCDGTCSRMSPRAAMSPLGGWKRTAMPIASAETNSSAAPNDAERRPAAEDERRERDEAAAVGHARLEAVAELEREPGAREAREQAAQDDVPVAHPDDVDAHGLRGLGVLAHGPRAQAPARPEQQDLHAPRRGPASRSTIGPWLSSALKIQPTNGSEVSVGRRHDSAGTTRPTWATAG